MQLSFLSSFTAHAIIAGRRFRSLLAAMTLLGGALGAVGGLSAATPPDGGTISIDVKMDDGHMDVPVATYMDAAGQALAGRGFTILDDPGHSAYVVELSIHREEVGTGSTRVAPVKSDMAHGGALGSVGTGAIISIPSGKSRHVALERTTIDMRVRRRDASMNVWKGTAVTVRPADAAERASRDLCNALMRAYPDQVEGIIGVP